MANHNPAGHPQVPGMPNKTIALDAVSHDALRAALAGQSMQPQQPAAPSAWAASPPAASGGVVQLGASPIPQGLGAPPAQPTLPMHAYPPPACPPPQFQQAAQPYPPPGQFQQAAQPYPPPGQFQQAAQPYPPPGQFQQAAPPYSSPGQFQQSAQPHAPSALQYGQPGRRVSPGPHTMPAPGGPSTPAHGGAPNHAGGSDDAMFMPQPGEKTTILGIDVKVAALLGYLLGIWPIWLVTEKGSRFMRFHSWQVALTYALMVALSIIATILGVVLSMISPLASYLVFGPLSLFELCFVCIYWYAAYKSYKGVAWKMPIIGKYARSIASR